MAIPIEKLTNAQWCIIDAITAIGLCTTKQIARELNMPISRVSATLGSCVKKGFVVKVDPDLWSTTPVGAKSHQQWRPNPITPNNQ